MRERPSDSLSLREVTDIAYLSPYHFAHVFRRVTDIPPGAFMATLRLERAKQSLLTMDLDVGEIYFEVGHNSLRTFTTALRVSFVGVSPGHMRDGCREKYELPSVAPTKPGSSPGSSPAPSPETGRWLGRF